MNTLPTDLQNIITDYVVQLNFSKVLDELDGIDYGINEDVYLNSYRVINDVEVRYYSCDIEDSQENLFFYPYVELEIFGKDWKKIDSNGKLVFKQECY